VKTDQGCDGLRLGNGLGLRARLLSGLLSTNAEGIWDWKRAEDPTKEPDLHFLTDRLLAEEAEILTKKRTRVQKKSMVV
jgi:hypothetical protein